jgi:heme exporter protein CcmD
MSGFFDMGGYGAYVWPAYLISALAIGGLAFFIWRRGRDLRRRLAASRADGTPAGEQSADGA